MALPTPGPSVLFTLEDLATDDTALIRLVRLEGRLLGDFKRFMNGTAVVVHERNVIEERKYSPPLEPVAGVVSFWSAPLQWNLSTTAANAIGGSYEFVAFLSVSTQTELVQVRFPFQLNEDTSYTLDADGRVSFAQVHTESEAIVLPAVLSTPGALLVDLKTVDGAASGLDADLVDGLHATDLVPAGGVAGQLLAKASNTDHDVEWTTAAGTGDMLAATYDPAGKAAQVLVATDIGTTVQAHSAVLAATTASFTTADETKLDGIEAGATADQSGAEIKTAYEAELDTNAFTDAEKAKLAGVEAGADVTDAANVAAAGAYVAGGTDVPVADGGTGASTAAGARTNLGVDAAGTDNSTPVTLAGALDYLTLSGQQITRNAIDLAADVSGVLPEGNGGSGGAVFATQVAATAAVAANTAKTTNATHTGDVAGAGALTAQPALITGKPAKATPVGADTILVADSAASDALKEVTLTSVVDLADMAAPQTVADTTDTLATGDLKRLTLYSNAAAVTVTVPTGTFAAKDWFLLQSTGAGGLSLSTTGITLNGSAPSTGVAQNESLLVIFTAANTISVIGGTV